MKRIKKSTILPLIVLLLFSCSNKENSFVDENIKFATEQTKRMLDSIGEPQGKYPRTINDDGSLRTTNIYGWTSGFFPGTLWYLYELTNDNYWKEQAVKWTMPLEPNKDNTKDHDVGFMMYCSYGNGLRLTKNKEYKNILIQTANSLITRYNPVIKSIKSWEGGKAHNDTTIWNFPVIIDNMMNLELLMWASKVTGDQKYREIAVNHANTTIKNHIRPDYSCYHVVDYDTITGKVLDQATAQGYADNSTWARGQAWGIYGFTMMYRETKDTTYLNIAKKMADFFLNNPNLPEDKISFWDFNAGQTSYTPEWKYDYSQHKENLRDASAAAIASSAMFELAQHTGDRKYSDAATIMLKNLASDKYRASLGKNGNFILMHSTGSLPHGKEIDVPLVYADYYFLEALKRYKEMNSNK